MKYISISEIGLVRNENQDYVCVVQNDNALLAVVCDGIGGANAGSVASTMAATLLKDAFLAAQSFDTIEAVTQWFHQTIHAVNKATYQQSLAVSEYGGMGTTLIALVILGTDAIAYNIGDSRIYRYDDAKLTLMSHDQSYAYEMYMRKEITLEEAETHPRRNVLMNAIGIHEKIDYETVFIAKGWDYLLLSSDGLHGYVSHQDIEKIFAKGNILDMRNALMTKAYEAGGYDNVSVILIEGDQYE